MLARPGGGAGRGLDRLGEGGVPRDDIEQSGQTHVESLLRPVAGAPRRRETGRAARTARHAERPGVSSLRRTADTHAAHRLRRGRPVVRGTSMNATKWTYSCHCASIEIAQHGDCARRTQPWGMAAAGTLAIRWGSGCAGRATLGGGARPIAGNRGALSWRAPRVSAPLLSGPLPPSGPHPLPSSRPALCAKPGGGAARSLRCS